MFSKDQLSLIIALGTDALANYRTDSPSSVGLLVRTAHALAVEGPPVVESVISDQPALHDGEEWNRAGNCHTCRRMIYSEEVNQVGDRGGHILHNDQVLHVTHCHRIARFDPFASVCCDPATKRHYTAAEDKRKHGGGGRSDIVLIFASASGHEADEHRRQFTIEPRWDGRFDDCEAWRFLDYATQCWVKEESERIVNMARQFPEMGWLLEGPAPDWWTAPCRHPHRDNLGYCNDCGLKARDCDQCVESRGKGILCPKCGMHDSKPVEAS